MNFDIIGGTKLADFITSNRFVDIIQGPVGSGKTKAMCVRVMRHAQEQAPSPVHGRRVSRFAIVRNTLTDLRRTTIRTWLECFPEDQYGRFKWGALLQHVIRFPWPGGDVEMEVDFLSLDKAEDIRRLRSTEYTGIAWNEASFILKSLFMEARGRLRFPPLAHGGPTWRGMMADTNAPDEDHWLAMMTGQVDIPPGLSEDELREYRWPEDWGFHLQPPAMLEQRDERGQVIGYVVNPKAENLANLPPRYYEDQIAGASRATIESTILNRVTLVIDGQPVWPMFRREYHVAREPLRPVPGQDVQIDLDFGRVYPAALFSQEIGGRLYVQYEMLGFNEPATVFAPKVKKFLETHYEGCRFSLGGDPKGADKGQATDQSSYEIFHNVFSVHVQPAPVKMNDIETRTEAVAYALNDNPSGVNYLVISPLCRTLIVGMAGRYHLVREDDGELRPKKDKYSNLCDALQYKVLRRGVGRRMIGLKPVQQLVPVRVRGHRTMRRIVA